MSSEDDKVRSRIAEIMSSAGVGYNSISLEVLYLLPREFIDRYIQLWENALGPTMSAPGDKMNRDGELGKAKTETRLKGKVNGAGAGGVGKRLAKSFSVKDEAAFRLKDRIDKRLRSIARDIREELLIIEDRNLRTRDMARLSDNEEGGNDIVVLQCKKCGRIMQRGYKFCPYDGLALSVPIKPEGSENDESSNQAQSGKLDNQAQLGAAGK